MNWNHLTAFSAVAETGSFSRGAERLLVSQPAISLQIAQLEANLGVRVFDRLPRGVRLTEAGQLLAGYARRITALKIDAERAMQELRGLHRGHLAVGASTTIGIYLLPQVMGQIHRRWPKIELELIIDNTDVIQHRLIDGTLDVGLTEGLVESPQLDGRVFFEDELVAIAPPGHRLTKSRRISASQLLAEPIILRETGSGTRAVIERALAARKLSASDSMTLGNTEAIKRAVAAGLGLAIVSKLTISAELASGRLILLPITDLRLHRPLHQLHLRGTVPTAAVNAFLTTLVEMYPRPGEARR